MTIGSASGWLTFAGIIARPGGDLVAHQLGVDALADRDELHLRGDLAAPGRGQLGLPGRPGGDPAGPQRRQADPDVGLTAGSVYGPEVS